jgi:hypothetical protein
MAELHLNEVRTFRLRLGAFRETTVLLVSDHDGNVGA